MTAEFLHEVEAEVHGGIDAAAAQQPAVFGDEQVGAPADLRVSGGELFGHGPVGGGDAAVQQPRLGQIGRADADARDIGAALMVMGKPWGQGAVLGDPQIDLQAGGGNDDDVGLLDLGNGEIGRDVQAEGAAHRSAVQRGGAHAEGGLGGRLVQGLP